MSKKVFILLSITIVLVNATGLFNEIFVGDSALYATIAKSFSQSGNYLDIYVEGHDWLDKPHFPFWVCALSIDIFGINTFAYKLPSLLFFIIGLFYTYKLAQKLYNTETAYLATLILGSSFHIIISNNDTRAEAILMGLIMGAVYYMYKLTRRFSTLDVFLASLFCAAAIMTKGVFVLIIIYAAVFGNMLVKREFARLFNLKWIIVFLLTLIFTVPELYAVYSQFDMHPETVVFGRTGVSGIKFFLWDSQFGRFFNTGPIKGSGDIFFFIHTSLWACAPWAIIGITALIQSGRSLFRKNQASEYLNFFGFTTMFIIFSISKFQLPHYLNIIFPFLAILTASFIISKSKDKTVTFIKKYSINLYAVAFSVVIASIVYFFRPNETMIPAVIFLSGLLFLIIFFNFSKTRIASRYIVYGILATALFLLYINLSFYPALLTYQSGSKAALYVNEQYPASNIVTTWNSYTLEYYSDKKLIRAYTLPELKIAGAKPNTVVYTEDKFLDLLSSENIYYTVLKSFDDYHVTQLKMDFFNHRTREKAITKRYLVQMTDPK